MHQPARAVCGAGPVVLVLVASLVGCATATRHVTDWGSITLAPGDTGTCTSNPCAVYLQLPPGEGRYRVTANQVDLGDYPAGSLAALGHFYDSKALEIVGAGVARAYVYIPQTR
ncbi:hypothetical protein L0E83_09490 [Marichromatium gracile]|uniref:hypothetical protein n=1 Tax=Marichromatium gracile TaxID=1048 RepID=UPI001F3D2A3A|nr:hypothetical protein [Marichromatium gracile]MCF1183667.1 hypothetical protein [Marichromatium gracile]